MTPLDSAPAGALRELRRAWNRFWFEPQSTAPLVLVRVGFGLLVLAWAAALTPDLLTFYGPDGLVPEAPRYGERGLWTLLRPFNSEGVVIGGYLLLLLAAVALILGFHSRLAALTVFVVLVSFERRNPYVANSGDVLMRIIALLLVLAPAGAAVSVDRWRRDDGASGFPQRPPWALRLLQIQLSVMYLSAVWLKARGESWNEGTATSFALRLDDTARFALPDAVTESPIVSDLMSYGVMGTELAVGVLIWSRRLRPYVLLLGIGLHLSIDLVIRVGFFSWAVLVAYLAFVPSETAERIIASGRRSTAAI
jgi:hypothetical protein